MLGDIFPLKPFVVAFQDTFNPFVAPPAFQCDQRAGAARSGAVVVVGAAGGWGTPRLVGRWTRRPRLWHSVVAAAGVITPLYLWHLPGMSLVAAAGIFAFAGVAFQVEPGTTAWWLTRPIWLGVLITVTLLLVAVPLGITSGQIADRWAAEQSLEMKRFELPGKEALITDVYLGARNVLEASVLVDAPLDDGDLVALRRPIPDELDGAFDLEPALHYRP